jgi:anti-sigma factor ChrR (cupin superfamily)
MTTETFTLVRAAEQSWKTSPLPGVSLALLRDDGGERTLLLRMESGAAYPRHRHPAGEELFVVEGSVTIGGRTLLAGDYLYTAPGAAHDVVSGRGCLLLIRVPQPIEIVERAA